MHVLKNVKDTALTIANNAHKHVATAPKNAEGWRDKQIGLEKSLLLIFSSPFIFRPFEGLFPYHYGHHS